MSFLILFPLVEMQKNSSHIHLNSTHFSRASPLSPMSSFWTHASSHLTSLSLLFNISTWLTKRHPKLAKSHIRTFDYLICFPSKWCCHPSRCLSQNPGKYPWFLPFHQQVLSTLLPKYILNLTSISVCIPTRDKAPLPPLVRDSITASAFTLIWLLSTDRSVSSQ